MPISTKPQAYELTFILDEKANQEDGVKKTAELKSYIEKAGGNVTKEELWGRRELAYPIKRNRSGFYVTVWFDILGSAIKDMEQHLLFDTAVIRSLITKAYTEAQPGSLYPVVEEEKSEKPGQAKEEAGSAEEMLRRSTAPVPKKDEDEDIEDMIPEEERLKKLDETLEELLKDEE